MYSKAFIATNKRELDKKQTQIKILSLRIDILMKEVAAIEALLSNETGSPPEAA